MAKKPPSPAPAAKRPRGRPPRPGGPTPQAEVQRAYRARLLAGGKAVRIVDITASPAFNPATQIVCDREQFERMDERLGDALSKIRLLTDKTQRLEQRNAFLETELKREERNNTNKIKELIVLKQQLEEAQQRPKKSRKT